MEDAEIEEIAESMSSIVIGTSSPSLIDLSWITPSSSPPVAKEKESILLPEWLDKNSAHKENTIQVLIEDKYYVFSIEKYPSCSADLSNIENRMHQQSANLSLHTLESRIFFLWDRTAAEKEIDLKNISYLKRYIRTGKKEEAVSPHIIYSILLSASVIYSVSFVYIDEESIGNALESIKKTLTKKETVYAPFRLKKSSTPKQLLEVIVGTVPGIRKKEAALLLSYYKSIYELIYDLYIEEKRKEESASNNIPVLEIEPPKTKKKTKETCALLSEKKEIPMQPLENIRESIVSKLNYLFFSKQ